jgi:Tol biopolymer transport system component
MGVEGSRLGSAARLSLVALVASFALAPHPAHAAFPGANGKIAFESYRNSNNDIYTIQPDGTGLTSLTASPSFGEIRPSWAPDGGRVAFIRCSPCAEATINADGSGLASFPEPVPIGAEPIAWSPDGQRVAFVEDSLASDIYVMNIDGTGLRNLTQNAPCAYSTAPSWSPHGDRIAYNGGPIGNCDTDEPSRGHSEVYTISVDGSGVVQLTSGGMGIASDPDWSPDGQKIAYIDCDPVGPTTYTCGIFVMSDSGANRTRLTDASDSRPTWSPDGTQIAFSRQEPTQGNFPNIYRMNTDGTGQTPVTTDAPWDDAPSWQPLPGPQRSDFKNAAQFCKADRTFMGESAFRQRYGDKENGSTAFGKCVSADEG